MTATPEVPLGFFLAEKSSWRIVAKDMTGYFLAPTSATVEIVNATPEIEQLLAGIAGNHVSNRLLIPEIRLMFCWNEERLIYKRMPEDILVNNDDIIATDEFSEKEICELMDFVEAYTNVLLRLKTRAAALQNKAKKRP